MKRLRFAALLQLLSLCATTLLTTSAFSADELQIIDVRRNIPLSDEEPIYKDFYLAGSDLKDLKRNQVVTVFRKIAIRDAAGVHSYGEIEIPVGQLTIIGIFNKIAVARETKLLSRNDLPMLEQIGIMTGDRIDVSTGSK